MNASDKQAARDRIAALRARYMSDCKQYAECRAGMNTVAVSSHAYLTALEALVDELTAPEPEADDYRLEVRPPCAMGKPCICGRVAPVAPEPEDMTRDLEDKPQ